MAVTFDEADLNDLRMPRRLGGVGRGRTRPSREHQRVSGELGRGHGDSGP